MKYTKSEIQAFRNQVCPQCPSTSNCDKSDSRCTNCPRIFNWKVYDDPEGLSQDWRKIQGNQVKNAK